MIQAIVPELIHNPQHLPALHTVAVGRTQKQDGEWGIDEQDIVHRMVFFLAALTPVCSAGSRCCRGQKGVAAGAAAGTVATSAASASSGVTMVTMSASETPRRWARAGRE